MAAGWPAPAARPGGADLQKNAGNGGPMA